MGATDWEAYVDAVAPVLGLSLDPRWRPGVERFLDLAAGMAARLDGVPLSEDHLDLDAVLTLPESAR